MRTRTLLVFASLVSLAGCGGLSAAPDCQNGICSAGCGAGEYRSGGNCVAFTECGAGFYVEQAGTAASDQVCSACPSGTFSNTTNAESCTPWKSCDAGNYVSTMPSSSNDRQCTPCASGTSAYGTNQTLCTSGNACKPGTTQTKAGTTTSPPVCASCTPGQYCAGGTAATVACTGDTWDNDSDPSTPCQPKTVCSPGSYVIRPGSVTSDRGCTPCLAGTFSISNNAPTCAPWRTCVAGTYVANSPSAAVDRQCVACAADTYTAEDNQSVCLAMNDCPAGKVQITPATSSTAAVCQACHAGQYCAGGAAPAITCPDDMWDHDNNPATVCIAKTTCPVGTYAVSPGGTAADRVCIACASGTFSSTSNAAVCTAWSDCVPGTFVAAPPTVTSNRQCLACSAGTTTSTINETACVSAAGSCAPGTAPDTNGLCKDCVAGQYCAGGGAAAVTCSADTFDNDSNPATACIAKKTCHAGLEYMTNPGSTTTDRSCGYCLSTTEDNQTTCPALPPGD